jgi:UDP-N-acetylmuramoyl-tripeptide--D-alanyl-D-alanine ligase
LAIAQGAVAAVVQSDRFTKESDLPLLIVPDKIAAYHASPEATIAALNLLASTPGRRRWAILGTMKELGAMSNSLHTKIGKTVASLGIDRLLVLIDGEADAILLGAGDKLSLGGCASHAEIVATLLKLVEPGDRLLFKASRSVSMDLAVQEFKQAWEVRSH